MTRLGFETFLEDLGLEFPEFETWMTRLGFETFPEDLGLEFEAFETRFTQDSNSRSFASETREFRDRKSELIEVCDVILSIQFKCLASLNMGSNILSTRFQNSNANNQILS
jgi:hypothetical protein